MNHSRKVLAAGLVAVVALLGSYLLRQMLPEEVEPTRVAPAPSLAAQPSSLASSEQASIEVEIEASDIVRLKIPAIDVDVKSSGEAWPRRSERCRATTECIDPPHLDEVVWYGAYARPSVPSSDSVLVFGHSNRYDSTWQAFNDLPALLAGDVIIVTTRTGEFVYEATDPVSVPYDQVPTSELIFQHAVDRLVLVTCSINADAATVVVATLVSATPR